MAAPPRPRHRLLHPVDQGRPGGRRRRHRRRAAHRAAPARHLRRPRGLVAALEEAAGRPARPGRSGRRRRAAARRGDARRAGEPVRDALLWNDLRSAGAARDLVAELGGPDACAELTGSVLNASYTVTKLRWLRDHEPEAAARVRRVLLPHDYLTWHLGGRGAEPTTDRGDASGTGYFATREDDWLPDLLERALGHDGRAAARRRAREVGRPSTTGARSARAPATTWPRRSGLGLGPATWSCRSAPPGVASMVTADPIADGTGAIAGFADATGRFLPLVCTINAARILDSAPRLLGVDHDGLAGWRWRRSPAPAASPCCPTSTASAPPTARGRRHPARPDHRAPPAPTSPAPPSRGCCSAWPTRSTPWPGSPGDAPAAAAHRRRGPQPGRARAGPAGLRVPVVAPRRPPSTSRSALPGRPPGRWPAHDPRPTGRCPRPDLPTGQTRPRPCARTTPRCANAPPAGTRRADTRKAPHDRPHAHPRGQVLLRHLDRRLAGRDVFGARPGRRWTPPRRATSSPSSAPTA